MIILLTYQTSSYQQAERVLDVGGSLAIYLKALPSLTLLQSQVMRGITCGRSKTSLAMATLRRSPPLSTLTCWSPAIGAYLWNARDSNIDFLHVFLEWQSSRECQTILKAADLAKVKAWHWVAWSLSPSAMMAAQKCCTCQSWHSTPFQGQSPLNNPNMSFWKRKCGSSNKSIQITENLTGWFPKFLAKVVINALLLLESYYWHWQWLKPELQAQIKHPWVFWWKELVKKLWALLCLLFQPFILLAFSYWRGGLTKERFHISMPFQNTQASHSLDILILQSFSLTLSRPGGHRKASMALPSCRSISQPSIASSSVCSWSILLIRASTSPPSPILMLTCNLHVICRDLCPLAISFWQARADIQGFLPSHLRSGIMQRCQL